MAAAEIATALPTLVVPDDDGLHSSRSQRCLLHGLLTQRTGNAGG